MNLSSEISYQSFLFTDSSSREKKINFSDEPLNQPSKSVTEEIDFASSQYATENLGSINNELTELPVHNQWGWGQKKVIDNGKNMDLSEVKINPPQTKEKKNKGLLPDSLASSELFKNPNKEKYMDNANIKNFLNSYNEMELEMKFNTDRISFFHFGCWNRDGGQEDGPLHEIIKVIKQQGNNVFGIIAGDNIYKQNKFINVETEEIVDHIPEGTDNSGGEYFETKIYNKNILDSGIDSLEKIGVPLFACVGNHDMETCDILLDEIDRTSILLERGKLSINLSVSKWIMPHNYYNLYCRTNSGLIQFIFIDTNLFLEDSDCYAEIELQRKTKMIFMLNWLRSVLKEGKATQIYIVGHVYLFGYKNKEIDQFVHLPNVDLLLDALNESPIRKIYYLCADIHNYQYIKFTGEDRYAGLTIENFTAGIGGGKPDKIPILGIGKTSIIMLNNVKIGKIELLGKEEPYGFMKYVTNGIEAPVITYYKVANVSK